MIRRGTGRSRARRNGKFYCSAACGGGKFCTWEEYQKAVRESRAEAQALGRGWEPEVWENLGWHWALRRGGMTVSKSRWRGRRYYSVLLNGSGGFGGDYEWLVLKSYATARQAIEAQKKAARAHLAKVAKVVQEIEAA